MRSNDPPDTSIITAASDDTFIALADDAQPGIQIPTFNFGDGTAGVYTVQGGGEIEFENRELRGETVYYFFIRLHSSVVSVILSPFLLTNAYSVQLQDVSTFNDSLARRPSTIIIDSTIPSVVVTADGTTADGTTQTAIIGSIVGVVVIVLIIAIAITVTVIAALVLKSHHRGEVSVIER